MLRGDRLAESSDKPSIPLEAANSRSSCWARPTADGKRDRITSRHSADRPLKVGIGEDFILDWSGGGLGREKPMYQISMSGTLT
jgi:hypothetical protein